MFLNKNFNLFKIHRPENSLNKNILNNNNFSLFKILRLKDNQSFKMKIWIQLIDKLILKRILISNNLNKYNKCNRLNAYQHLSHKTCHLDKEVELASLTCLAKSIIYRQGPRGGVINNWCKLNSKNKLKRKNKDREMSNSKLNRWSKGEKPRFKDCFKGNRWRWIMRRRLVLVGSRLWKVFKLLHKNNFSLSNRLHKFKMMICSRGLPNKINLKA